MAEKTKKLAIVRVDSIAGGNPVYTVRCPQCDTKLLIEDDNAREFYRIDQETGAVFPEVVCNQCRFADMVVLENL